MASWDIGIRDPIHKSGDTDFRSRVRTRNAVGESKQSSTTSPEPTSFLYENEKPTIGGFLLLNTPYLSSSIHCSSTSRPGHVTQLRQRRQRLFRDVRESMNVGAFGFT